MKIKYELCNNSFRKRINNANRTVWLEQADFAKIDITHKVNFNYDFNNSTLLGIQERLKSMQEKQKSFKLSLQKAKAKLENFSMPIELEHNIKVLENLKQQRASLQDSAGTEDLDKQIIELTEQTDNLNEPILVEKTALQTAIDNQAEQLDGIEEAVLNTEQLENECKLSGLFIELTDTDKAVIQQEKNKQAEALATANEVALCDRKLAELSEMFLQEQSGFKPTLHEAAGYSTKAQFIKYTNRKRIALKQTELKLKQNGAL